MSYSFFGTCSNDYDQFIGCLKTIIDQTIKPRQIILINSGDKNIEKLINNLINKKKIEIIYIEKKLPRVNALNLALENSNSIYSFRFDSRARFEKDYAANVLQTFNDKTINAKIVGGAPKVLSQSNTIESKLCASLMSRSYVFFYPKHRRKSFNGYSSSVYLGCFETALLKQIKYRETESLISEDSLIVSQFLDKGYNSYLNSKIKVSYISRNSFINILNLFNTYGYCRANTILYTKKLFISARHLIVFLIIVIFNLICINYSILSIFLFPFGLLFFNIIGEIILLNLKAKIFVSLCATLCQFSWIIGFVWRILTILNTSKVKSNFIS